MNINFTISSTKLAYCYYLIYIIFFNIIIFHDIKFLQGIIIMYG